MADDISRNIIIQVSAPTDDLEKNINDINQLIDGLTAKQKQLTAAGEGNSAAFKKNAEDLAVLQKTIQDVTKQLNANVTALKPSGDALQKNQGLVTALTSAKEKYSKSVADNSKKVKELDGATNALSDSIEEQQSKLAQNKTALDGSAQSISSAVNQSALLAQSVDVAGTALKQQKTDADQTRSSFDAFKKTVDSLESSFNKMKGASGTFAPGLKEAASGFSAMKSGTNAGAIQAVQKTQEQIVKIKKTGIQQVEDYAKQSGIKLADEAIGLLSNSIKQESAAKVAALEKDKTTELSNKSLTSAQKLAIEQQFNQQENAIKVKAFKEEQDLAIVQAVINGALAVTKVSAQSGVLAPLEIGVVIAETAAQVAKITAQKPPAYAKGGLHYSSDGRGGVLPGYSRTDNTNAYLRSGEGVVVSEAMRNPWARNLVSAINVGFGGRDFSITNPGKGYAVGGIFTDGGDANRYYNQPVTDQKNLANTIAYQMVNNFPPVYVDVKDINNQQNILAQTINRVNL